MATLGVTFALAGVSMGGSKKSQQQGPPMNATSKEEEAFITYVFILSPGLADARPSKFYVPAWPSDGVGGARGDAAGCDLCCL